MPELSVAPTPFAAIKNGVRANESASANRGADNASDAPAKPFSATLSQQIKAHATPSPKAPAVAKTSNPDNANNSNDVAAAPATTPDSVASSDVLAALMPMLKGTPSTEKPAADEHDKDSPDANLATSDSAPTTLPALNVVVANPVSNTHAAANENAQDSTARGNGKSGSEPPATAILASGQSAAADAAASAKSAADGKAQATVTELASKQSPTTDATSKATAEPLPNGAQSNTNAAATAGSFQASLDAAQQTHRAANAFAGHPVSRSETTVGSNAWNQEVADRVVWMAGQKESRADLVLNPPQLGRIEISLTVKGDQVNANFTAANPNVREALENALPRLREVLNDAGIQLGQANVGANTPQFASQQGETGHNPASGRSQNGADSETASLSVAATAASGAGLRRGTGLVDAFA